MHCADCDVELGAAYAVRDWAEELGPFCAACALETIANVQAAADAGALRFERWHSPRREWIERGGRSLDRQDAPPTWATDLARWESATAAVRSRWTDFESPWSIVVQVYDALGGAM